MQQRIQNAVEKFAKGLTHEIVAVIYDDLIADLQEQRANGKGIDLPGNGKPSRKNGKKASRKNGKRSIAKKTARKAAAKKATDGKRTPAQIEKIATRALAAITKKPGRGIEAIAKAMKIESKSLSLPVRKLISDKAIRTKGERRATTYFPKAARKNAAKATTKKAAKKK